MKKFPNTYFNIKYWNKFFEISNIIKASSELYGDTGYGVGNFMAVLAYYISNELKELGVKWRNIEYLN